MNVEIRVRDFAVLLAWLQYQERLLQELRCVLHQLTELHQERPHEH
jgi:hypothetical protein